jgi:hypothetical protein
MPIRWYYMWSDKYKIFHHLLQDRVKEPEFTLCPIYIEQSVFDTELYKDTSKHAWDSSLIKVNAILESLKGDVGSYVLFTDIDLVVKPTVYQNIKQYIDEDQTIVFLEEGDHLNIGFMLMKLCPEVIDFWTSVKNNILHTPGLDQDYVNSLILLYKSKWTKFHNQQFTCSNTWDGTTEFSVLQVLSSCLGKEYDFVEKVFEIAQHMDMNDYMKYFPPDLIPYIYKFQEILMESHEEVSSAVNS